MSSKDVYEKRANSFNKFQQSGYVAARTAVKDVGDMAGTSVGRSASTYNPLDADAYNFFKQQEFLKGLKVYQPKIDKRLSFTSDYKSTQQINSMADVLYSGNFLSAIVRGTELFKNLWSPLLYKNERGKWDPQYKIFLNNQLVNMGETLDIFANPVKGLLMEGWDGLKKATGTSDGGGRTNYDWDIHVGNRVADFFANMAAEFVTDPANLVTIGLGSTVKGVARGAAGKLLKNGGKEALGAVVEHSFKRAGKTVTKEAAQNIAQEATKVAMKETFKMAGTKGVTKPLQQLFRENFKKFVVNNYGLKASGISALDKSKKVFKQAFKNNITDSTATIIKSLNKTKSGVEFTDKVIFRAAMTPSGLYPTYGLVKKVKPEYLGLVKKTVDKTLTTVLESPVGDGLRSAQNVAQVLYHNLDTNVEVKDLLAQINAGEITQKDVNTIITAKVNKHLPLLRKAANSAELPENSIDAVNTVVKKELGYKSLDEYIQSMKTLKGFTDRAGEYAIYSLEQFKKEIEHKELKAKIKIHIDDLKQTKAAYQKVSEIGEVPLEKEIPKAVAKEHDQLYKAAKDVNSLIELIEGMSSKEYQAAGGFAGVAKQFYTNGLNKSALAELLQNIRYIDNVTELKNFNASMTKTLRHLEDVCDDANLYQQICDNYAKAFANKARALHPAVTVNITNFSEESLKDYIANSLLYANLGFTGVAKPGFNAMLILPAEQTAAFLNDCVDKYFTKHLGNLEDDALIELREAIDGLKDSIEYTVRELGSSIKTLEDADAFVSMLEVSFKDINRVVELYKNNIKYIDDQLKVLAPKAKSAKTVAKNLIKQMTDASATAKQVLELLEKTNLSGSKNIDSNNLKQILDIPDLEDKVDFLIKELDCLDLTETATGIKKNADIEAKFRDIQQRSKGMPNSTTNSVSNYDEDFVRNTIDDVKEILTDLKKGTVTFEDLAEGHKKLTALTETMQVVRYYDKPLLGSETIIYKKFTQEFKNIDKLSHRRLKSKLHKFLKANGKYSRTEVTAIKKIRTKDDVKNLIAKYATIRKDYRLNPPKLVDNKDIVNKILYITNEIAPERIQGKQITLAAEGLYYSLHGEQVANIATFLSEPQLVENVVDMCNPEGTIGHALHVIANSESEFAPRAENLIALAHNFEVYYNTFNKINQLSADCILTPHELTALQTALQKEYKTNLFDASVKFEETVDRVIENTEQFYNMSYVSSQSFRQDIIAQRNPKIYKDKWNIGATHQAAEDAKLTYAVAMEEKAMQDFLKQPEYAGKKFVAFDIETIGLDTKANDILEFGVYDALGQTPFYVQYSDLSEVYKRLPTRSVLRKTFSEYNTYEEQVKAFIEHYYSKDAATKKETYEAFLTRLFSQGDDVVLLTHNGTKFDIPTIVDKLKKNGVDPELVHKFENATFVDNLVVLRNAEGFTTLNKEARDAIAQVLKEHIDDLSLNTDSVKFFDAGIKPMRNEVREFIKDLESDNVSNPNVDKIKATSSASTLTNETKLAQLFKNVDSKFNEASNKTIKVNEKDLPIIAKSDVQEIVQYAKLCGASPDMIKLVKSLGMDTTLTRVLYRNDNAFNMFGYKTAVDADAITDWFMFEAGDTADVNLLQRYSAIAMNMNKMKLNVMNTAPLSDPTLLAQLKPFIEATKNNIPGSNKTFYRMFRTDIQDTAALYCMAKKIYNEYKLNHLEGDLLSNAQFKELATALNASTSLEHRILGALDDMEAYDASIDFIKKGKDLEEAITDMELTQGANRIYSAEKQFANSAMQRTYKYVKECQMHYKQLSKAEQSMYVKQAADAFENLCVRQTLDVISKNPDEMLEHMLRNKAPFMFYDLDDIQIKAYANKLMEAKDAYKAKGISFYKDEDHMVIYFNKEQRFDYYVNEDGFHAVFNDEDSIIDFNKSTQLDLSEMRNADELTAIYKQMGQITNGQSIGTLGNQIDEAGITSYFYALPEVVQKDMSKEMVTKTTMFQGFTFDTMNLGTIASRRVNNRYIPSDMTRAIAVYNSQIVKRANKNNLMIDYWLNKDMAVSTFIQQYGEDVTRKMLTQNEDYVAMMLTTSTKHKGLGFHKQGYRVIQLDATTKDGWNVITDVNNSVVVVPKFMYNEIYDALNTSLLYDNPVYKIMHQITYMTKLGQITTVGKVFRDIIESQIKNMIETRNAIGVLRNNVKAGMHLHQYKKALCDILNLSLIDYDKIRAVGIDPEDFALKYISNRVDAEHLLIGYYNSLKDVMKMDSASMFLSTNKKLYFEKMCRTGMDEKTFDTMHTILTESGTLGKLPRWGKYTQDLHKLKQKQFMEDYTKGLIGDQMLDKSGNLWERAYDSISALGNLLMTPAQYCDQINRISEYLTFADTGLLSPTAALNRVARTHFDAAIKTESEMLAELAIPFYSFFKHNMLYWAKACAQNPWAARMFADFIREVSDEDSVGDVSDFERLNNVALMNQKFAGNIMLTPYTSKAHTETRISKKGNPYQVNVTEHPAQVTLKLNLPFMEAYQMLTQPVGYLAGSANPILQAAAQSWLGNNPNVPTGLTETLDIYRPYNFDEGARSNVQWASIVPFIGPTLQRWGKNGYAQKQYQDTGFLGNLILPSVFGRVKRFSDYDYASQDYALKPYASKARGLSEKQYAFIKKYGLHPDFSSSKSKKKGYKSRAKGNRYSKLYARGYNKYSSKYYTHNKMYYQNDYKNYYGFDNYKNYRYVNSHRSPYSLAKPFYPQNLPKRPRTSAYKLLYNSYGKSRIQYLGMPRTVRNTPYMLRSYFSYTK